MDSTANERAGNPELADRLLERKGNLKENYTYLSNFINLFVSNCNNLLLEKNNIK